MSDGVLSDRELRQAVRDGWIVSPIAIDDQQFQPASLDLRLGPDAYQLRASFLPFRESVPSRLGERGLAESDLVIDQLSLTGAGAAPTQNRPRGAWTSSRGSSPTRRRGSTRSARDTTAGSTWRSRRSRFRCAYSRAFR